MRGNVEVFYICIIHCIDVKKTFKNAKTAKHKLVLQLYAT
jgi:hypothetical protein